jgi:hypothetical protein
MPGLMGDDIVRQAGVAGSLQVAEIVELQRFAVLVVKAFSP